MTALKMLVVEDSASLQVFYRDLLDDPRLEKRFSQTVANSAEAAMTTISMETPDIVLLDWILPGSDGMTVLDAIRSNLKTRGAMVFVISCLSSQEREAQALRLGADDFLAKPFDREMLVSRLLTLAHKLEPESRIEERIRLDELELEMPAGQLWIGVRRVDLHHKEAELLRLLLKRPDVVHSPEQLWSAAWGYPCRDFGSKLEIAVSSLKEKLGACWGSRLERIGEKGYVLNRPV